MKTLFYVLVAACVTALILLAPFSRKPVPSNPRPYPVAAATTKDVPAEDDRSRASRQSFRAKVKVYLNDRFFRDYVNYRAMNEGCKSSVIDESGKIERFLKVKVALLQAMLARPDLPETGRQELTGTINKVAAMDLTDADYVQLASSGGFQSAAAADPTFCPRLSRMLDADIRQVEDALEVAKRQ